MTCSGFVFWLDLVLRLLTPLLVVGGWIVVHQLQGLQARRKLLREEADKMREAVHNLYRLAVEFHTQQYSAKDRAIVLRSMTDLDRRRAMLPKIARGKRVLGIIPIASVSDSLAVKLNPELIADLNQAITKDHFDDPTEEPIRIGDAQIWRIGLCCNRLVQAVDDALIAALD